MQKEPATGIFEEDIQQSLTVLKNGGIVVCPTDTVWGIACDATRDDAVEKVQMIKSRNKKKSLIVLVNGFPMLERYVKEIPLIVYDLLKVSDTPLTIVYPEGRNLAGGVCAEDDSVAIRICNEPFVNELIDRFRKPLVSTSANISGEAYPANFDRIDPRLLKKADYVVGYRRDDRKQYKPSPVIRVELNGIIRIIRK
ncbi:MAG: threonylcarbamoyl-AMP synthase [Bacteroidales bacterium]|nr:threonylcarbamoyl-AMP synthase [Bacteroidales bacterium]